MPETRPNESELDQFLNELGNSLARNGADSPEVVQLLQVARAKNPQWLEVAQTAIDLRRAYEQEADRANSGVQTHPTANRESERKVGPKSLAGFMPLLTGAVLGACLLAILLSMFGQRPANEKALAVEVASSLKAEVGKQISEAINSDPKIATLPKVVAGEVRSQIRKDVDVAIKESPQIANLPEQLASKLKDQVHREVADAIAGSPAMTKLADELAKDIKRHVRTDLAELVSKSFNSSDIAEKVMSGVSEKLTSTIDAELKKLAPRMAAELAPEVAKLVKQDIRAELASILDTRPVSPVSGSSTSRVVFAPDGDRAIFIGVDGRGVLWPSLEKERQISIGKTFKISSCAFSRDGSQALLGCWDHTIRWVEDVSAFSEEKAFRLEGPKGIVGHRGIVTSVAFSSDARSAFSAGADRSICIWDLPSGKLVHRFELPSSATGPIAFSPNGHFLLVGGERSTVALWDLDRGKEIRDLGKIEQLTALLFSPDSEHFLTATGSGVVFLWETYSGNKVRAFEGPKESIQALAFSADSRQFLTGSREGTARVWGIDLDKPFGSVEQGRESIVGVAFLRVDEKRMISTGSTKGILKVWDIGSNKVVRDLSARTD